MFDRVYLISIYRFFVIIVSSSPVDNSISSRSTSYTTVSRTSDKKCTCRKLNKMDWDIKKPIVIEGRCCSLSTSSIEFPPFWCFLFGDGS